MENTLEKVYFEYDEFDEGFKDGLKKASDAINTAGKNLVKPVEDGAKKLATSYVSLFKNKVDRDSEEFKSAVDKAAAGIKVGAIAVLNIPVFILPCPGSSTAFNALFTAPLCANDPILKQKVEQIKQKAIAIKNKFFGKKTDNPEEAKKLCDEAKKEYSSLVSDGYMLAKDIDRKTGSAPAVQESCDTSVSRDYLEFCIANDLFNTVEFFESAKTYISECGYYDTFESQLNEFMDCVLF